jgi:hypothetical protein
MERTLIDAHRTQSSPRDQRGSEPVAASMTANDSKAVCSGPSYRLFVSILRSVAWRRVTLASKRRSKQSGDEKDQGQHFCELEASSA